MALIGPAAQNARRLRVLRPLYLPIVDQWRAPKNLNLTAECYGRASFEQEATQLDQRRLTL